MYKAGQDVNEDGAVIDFVAVKVARVETSDDADRQRRRLEAHRYEAGALLSLPRHTHVLTATSVHESQRHGMLIVLELAPEGHLKDWLRGGGDRRDGERVKAVAGVALGLRHVHDLGLAHQDLKPGNVLMFEDGVARVSDFGLLGGLSGVGASRQVSTEAGLSAIAEEEAEETDLPFNHGDEEMENEDTLVVSGSRPARPASMLSASASTSAPLVAAVTATEGESKTGGSSTVTARGGTPTYMAPEQLEGEHVSPRSDMWAFGLLLAEVMVFPEALGRPEWYRKLCGRSYRRARRRRGERARAKAGEESVCGMALRRLMEVGEKRGTAGSEWWSGVCSVVEGCLHEERKERMTSGEAVEALKGVCEGVGVGPWMAEACVEGEGAEGCEVDLVLGRARWFAGYGKDVKRACGLYERALESVAAGSVEEKDVRVEYCIGLAGAGEAEAGMGQLRRVLGMCESAGDRADVLFEVVAKSESMCVLGLCVVGEVGLEVRDWPEQWVDVLLERGCENECEEVSEGVVSWVIGSFSAECVRRLVSDGCALLWASTRGHMRVCEKLMDVGAEVDTLWDGRSALWIAAFDGHVRVMEAVLLRGASIDLRGGGGVNSSVCSEPEGPC